MDRQSCCGPAAAISRTSSGVSPARAARLAVEVFEVRPAAHESAGAEAAMSRRDARRVAAGLQIALTEMNQMALGLQLAGAAQVGLADPHARENVLAEEQRGWR